MIIATDMLCDRSIFALFLLVSVLAPPAVAQEMSEDMVGQNKQAWVSWKTAMQAVERNELEAAGRLLESVSEMHLSDLRLALMADRTGTLRLEQWTGRDDAPAAVKELMAKIRNGRRQKGLAEDGWHFAAIGRFQYADANFKALDESNPDPVALLELARRNPNRHDILLKLINNTEVGPSARRFIEILNHGEELLRIDPFEIVANIAKLGGSPRQVYNATNHLKDSGEYAIPHLIAALQDSARSSLHPAIIQVIPKIGRAALNPLSLALEMNDDVTQVILIKAVTEIGYKQVVPYLAKLVRNPNESGQVRAAAAAAMDSWGISSSEDLSGLFYQLAENYYDNIDSLQADPRSDAANVWYLRGSELHFIPIPRVIFNDVMAMRCCEEALLANPDQKDATALWLAANFQRESKLGLDVESDKPDPLADKDSTRPENYPRAIYFARAAGALYNHMILSRAFQDRDAGVALGGIAALADTAGAPSLVGAENLKQPLVQMLSFPNRQVRVKAALTLGRALPSSPFSGSRNVMPVLAEALLQSQRQVAMIIDPDDNVRNKFQALLRSIGYECALGANLYQARQNGEDANLTSFDVILIGSDVVEPDVSQTVKVLRDNFETAATPILIVAKENQVGQSGRLARQVSGVEVLLVDVLDLGDPDQTNEQIVSRISRASKRLGMRSLDRDLSLELALQASQVLRGIAESNLDVYDFSRVVPALITSLKSKSESLRTSCAHTLALAPSQEAQSAVAESALDIWHSQEERIAAFGALAESARRNGNLLGEQELVSRLVDFTMNEKNLVLRSAASKALGALDLRSNKASEIIRSQYNG